MSSEPALYRFSGIARKLIKAEFGLGGVLMNDIDQLLKQDEVAWHCPYACPNHNTIEPRLLESARKNGLGRFAKVR